MGIEMEYEQSKYETTFICIKCEVTQEDRESPLRILYTHGEQSAKLWIERGWRVFKLIPTFRLVEITLKTSAECPAASEKQDLSQDLKNP